MLPLVTDEQRTGTDRRTTQDRTHQTFETRDGEGEGREKGNGAGFWGRERVRFYLRKRAASEEAEQPETLTGDSYTDLRRQDRGTRNKEAEGK